MPADWPFVLFLLLLGPAVGSFLGVLVDRLAAGEDSVRGPSRCTGCGARLKWRDMVPIVSALALRGRCRVCGAPIPGHLIRIEFAGLLAAALAVALGQSMDQTAVLAGFLWCLTGLFYSDLLHYRLPNVLTAPLLILGLGLAALDPERGVAEGLLSAVLASGAFLALRWGYRAWRGHEGLGLGDVKLMAGIGAGLGWAELPLATLFAAGLALAVAAMDALRGRGLPQRDTRLPFGTHLVGGAVLTLVL
ncbi:MAG: prepilin peptidase [Rhodobacter sp.]|nr:prepilin peptidase [Rhodobacter sp.]